LHDNSGDDGRIQRAVVACHKLDGQDVQAFPSDDEPEADVCLLHAPWVLQEETVPRQWDLLSLLPDAAPDPVEAQAAGESEALRTAVDPLSEELEALEVRPKKTDISVRVLSLGWAPYWRDERGGIRPAY